MSIVEGPNSIISNLIVSIDAKNTKSYPGSGTTWANLSSTSNNFTINNLSTVIYTNSSYFRFNNDGTTSQAAALSSFANNLSAAHTIEVFVYPTTSYFMFANTDNPDFTTYFSYGEGNRAYDKSGSNFISLNATLNTWNHIVVTFNGTSTARSYKNGGLQDQKTNFNMSSIATGRSLYIGARPWSAWPEDFNVAIWRFYNRELTNTEIKQNFEALRARFGL